MKRILVIGEHSYIGTSFRDYIQKNEPDLEVALAGARDEAWKRVDLSRYDAVLHAAGKAHADVGRVSEQEKREYYRVNFELAVEAAKASKAAGVRQFIYPSSVIIYGEAAPIGKQKVITRDTEPSPANFYGDSKLLADLAIQKMNGGEFKTAVLRLPMVYGPNSRGNYPILAKMAKRLPVFPNIRNERSMLYIENLCELFREIIKFEDGGLFYPQNAEYASTSDLVKWIADAAGKKIRLLKLANPLAYLAGIMPGKARMLANKAFGSCVYDQDMSRYRDNGYQKYGFIESIRRTEGK